LFFEEKRISIDELPTLMVDKSYRQIIVNDAQMMTDILAMITIVKICPSC